MMATVDKIFYNLAKLFLIYSQALLRLKNLVNRVNSINIYCSKECFVLKVQSILISIFVKYEKNTYQNLKNKKIYETF